MDLDHIYLVKYDVIVILWCIDLLFNDGEPRGEWRIIFMRNQCSSHGKWHKHVESGIAQVL